MKWIINKSFQIAAVSLVGCIASAVIASSDSIVGSGWESLGYAIWITVLITLPTFAIFCTFLILTVVKWIKNH
ncbi:MAG: hypothetical protein M3Q44_03280 [bacterium]|nr:hypothetical protein [bacterium]